MRPGMAKDAYDSLGGCGHVCGGEDGDMNNMHMDILVTQSCVMWRVTWRKMPDRVGSGDQAAMCIYLSCCSRRSKAP